MRVLLCMFLLFAFASASAIEIVEKLSSGEIPISHLCDSLKKNQALLQCASENPAAMGESFLESLRTTSRKIEASELEPVVLFPGMGGSGLDARIDKPDSPAWYCFKRHDWFRIWLNVAELLVQPCWFDNLDLTWNVTNGDQDDRAGVETRPTDFGGLQGVEYLDYIFGLPVPLTGVYNDMIASFQKVGYQPGVTLFGAPFDFRMATTQHEMEEEGLNNLLDALIVHARNVTGGKKVHLLTHSLGGPTALAWLNTKTQEYLDENIASFLPIAGPWSGAAKPLRTAISGDDFGIAVLGNSILGKEGVMKIARKAGGMMQLLPNAHFWPADQVFVTANVNGQNKSYTAASVTQLLADATSQESVEIYKFTKNILENLGAPRVLTHCVYGFGVPTESHYNYKNGFGEQPEIFTNNLGDGTVPIESLAECGIWDTQQTQPVIVTKLDTTGHADIIKSQVVFDYLIKAMAGSAIKQL